MSRPKGYADWNPKAETLDLIDNVRAVLTEYRSLLPLTARQIFYRLVGAYGFPKDERAYARLCEALVRARRAQMIPFSSIRDDGTTTLRHEGGYDSPSEFWEGLKDSARYYTRDPMEGQPVRIELWCEAAGMAPQLARVARPFGVNVYSTGGFSSVTVTHEISQRALNLDKPTVFLHVGDFDPSGESIFEAMTRDAESFVLQSHPEHPGGSVPWSQLRELPGPQLRAKRVALTADQVEEHDLPTAPPKRTDTRSRNWIGETCQAEAMPPDLLADTVREAIEAEIDDEQFQEIADQSEQERDGLIERLAAAMEEDE